MDTNSRVVVLLLGLLLSGCGATDYNPIEGKIALNVSRGMALPDEGFAIINILLESEKIYECSNYEIVYEIKENDREIEITVEGVKLFSLNPEKPVCVNPAGPAQNKIRTQMYDGKYDLIIKHTGEVDKYSISVNVAANRHKITVIENDTSFSFYRSVSYYQALERERSAIAKIDNMVRNLSSLGFDVSFVNSTKKDSNALLEIQKRYDYLMRSVTTKSEAGDMLVNIMQSGLSAGLEFRLFRPMEEQLGYFYKLLPVHIKVTGTRQEYDDFFTNLSTATRLLSVHSKPVSSCAKMDNINAELVIVIPVLTDEEKLNSADLHFSNLSDMRDVPKSKIQCIGASKQYPLDSLKFVNTLNQGEAVWAVLLTPDSEVLRVRTGDYIEGNMGQIVDIKETYILIQASTNNPSGTITEKIIRLERDD